MNYWHDIEPGTKDVMNVIVEIPKGSHNKYEIDKETGLIALDRVLYSAQDYPFDYGFIPQTLWHDGDALDAILLTSEPLLTGILVRVRAVGLMGMIDDGESDSKVLAVPVKDPRWDDVKDIGDVNKHTLKEIEHFFCTYKQLQDKVCSVTGFEGKAKAVAAFEESRKLYGAKFPGR